MDKFFNILCLRERKGGNMKVLGCIFLGILIVALVTFIVVGLASIINEVPLGTQVYNWFGIGP